MHRPGRGGRLRTRTSPALAKCPDTAKSCEGVVDMGDVQVAIHQVEVVHNVDKGKFKPQPGLFGKIEASGDPGIPVDAARTVQDADLGHSQAASGRPRCPAAPAKVHAKAEPAIHSFGKE